MTSFFENLPLDMEIFPRLYGFLGFEGLMNLLSTSRAICEMFLFQAKIYNKSVESLNFTIDNPQLRAGSWLRFFQDTTLTIKHVGNLQHFVKNQYAHVEFVDDFVPNDKISVHDHLKMLANNSSILIFLDKKNSFDTKCLTTFSKITLKKVILESRKLQELAASTLIFEECSIRFDNKEIVPKVYDRVRMERTHVADATKTLRSIQAKFFQMLHGGINTKSFGMILNTHVERFHFMGCDLKALNSAVGASGNSENISLGEIFSGAVNLTELIIVYNTGIKLTPYLHLLPNLTKLIVDVSENSDLEHISKCEKLNNLSLIGLTQIVLDLPEIFPEVSILHLRNIDLCSHTFLKLKLKSLFINSGGKPVHNFKNIMDCVTTEYIWIGKFIRTHEDFMIPYHPLLSSCSVINLLDNVDIIDGDNSLEYRKRVIKNRSLSDNKDSHPKRNASWLKKLQLA
jgi:hypothetical protein